MPMWYGLGMKSSISVSFRGAAVPPLLTAVVARVTALATTSDRTTATRRRRDRAGLLIVSSLAPSGDGSHEVYTWPNGQMYDNWLHPTTPVRAVQVATSSL